MLVHALPAWHAIGNQSSSVAAARRRLTIVSNRGPVSFGRAGDGSRVVRRGGGGLVTALRPLVSRHDVTWIAECDDRRGPSGRRRGRATGRSTRPVATALRTGCGSSRHDPDDFDRYYNVFANPTLWFLQHYLWDLGSRARASTRVCTRHGRATRR